MEKGKRRGGRGGEDIMKKKEKGKEENGKR